MLLMNDLPKPFKMHMVDNFMANQDEIIKLWTPPARESIPLPTPTPVPNKMFNAAVSLVSATALDKVSS